MSTPTSDLRSLQPEPPPPGERVALPSWKNELRARAAAQRAPKQKKADSQPALPGMEDAASPASIAARVAARYAGIPSYREMLAAQAAAAASTPASGVDTLVAAAATPAHVPAVVAEPAAPPPPAVSRSVQQDLLRYSVSSDSLPPSPVTPAQARPWAVQQNRAEWQNPLSDPLEDAIVEPAQPLPARLIDNPRELVAPRKARPRLAEGPLREEVDSVTPAESRTSAAASTLSAAKPGSSPQRSPARPQWLSIQLDTETARRDDRSSSAPADAPHLQVASFEDRAIAALVDCGLVASAFLLFVVVFAFSTTHFPTGRIAIAGAAVILVAMGLLYQFLFFTLTDATPGMRYARIALCTFDDENPARPAMRGRVAALLLSALPLGLGFLWAVFDEDSLGWHDRVTRTYQRSYREF